MKLPFAATSWHILVAARYRYTQFMLDHALGTVPYRWDQNDKEGQIYSMANLVEAKRVPLDDSWWTTAIEYEYLNMGVSRNDGTPVAGWFISWTIPSKN